MSDADQRYVTHRSRHSYADTVAILTKSIVEGGNTIFATIDQSAAARGVGLTLRPTTLIIFGNPKGGTPLMEAFPSIALDLPLKLLVWEEGESANVAFFPASEIAKRYGIDATDKRFEAMDVALEELVGGVT